MKNIRYFLPLFLLMVLFGSNTQVFAQSEPVLYFCDRYDDDDGEVGVRDRFSVGPITVMVKCATSLKLTDCHIQYDKINPETGKSKFYKKFDFVIERDMKYVFFKKSSDNDMRFDDPGIYRVFLLDDDDKTIASALIQIID